MQKDTLKSWRLAKRSLVLTGQHCELTVPFEDLAAIIEALAQVTTQDDESIVPGPRQWPTTPPMKYGKTRE